MEECQRIEEGVAQKVPQETPPNEVRWRIREEGRNFARALEHLLENVCGSGVDAWTLQSELEEFAASSIYTDSGSGAPWHDFGGIEAYAAYLCHEVRLPGGDVKLVGLPAWQRLSWETEVAIRLVFIASTVTKLDAQLEGSRAVGCVSSEEVLTKLMFAKVFDPLHKRLCYVRARAEWSLQRLRGSTRQWASITVADARRASQYACLNVAPEHLPKSGGTEDALLEAAWNSAASRAVSGLSGCLDSLLLSGCLHPNVLLKLPTSPQPCAEPTLGDPDENIAITVEQEFQGDTNAARVQWEMRRRATVYQKSESRTRRKDLRQASQSLLDMLASQTHAAVHLSLLQFVGVDLPRNMWDLTELQA